MGAGSNVGTLPQGPRTVGQSRPSRAEGATRGRLKLSEFTAFAKHLTMRVSKELRALLKVAHKAHPELQALLIDLMQY